MQAFLKPMFIILVLAALTSACAPAISPAQIQEQVQTSVALTVQAQNQIGTQVAQTVQAQTGAQPLATATDTPVALPTLTPIVIASPTPFAVAPPHGGGGGGSTSSKPQQYACEVVDQVPNDNSPATILKVGDPLGVKWTIKNVGTKTWEALSPWTLYYSAVDSDVQSNLSLTMSSVGLQTNLGTDIAPGDTVTLGVVLTAPASFDGPKPIFITTQWTIIAEGVKFCRPYINTEIIRPGMTP